MDFGINLPTAADSWKVVKRAEELGFTNAWFFDTHPLNADPFVAMAASAMETSKIRLGTGVLIPSNRIAPVTANALASLNTLAPGRIDFGISTGFTARRAMGLGPVKLADMKEYIRIVEGLLARETVEWEFEGKRRKIRFLNPELNLINTTDPIPVYISAFGPRSQALTAELGAGWITSIRSVDHGIGELNAMGEAWTTAGRDPKDLYALAVCGGCLLRDGEDWDSPRVKEVAGPAVSIVLHNLAEQSEFGSIGLKIPPQLQSVLDQYMEIYKSYEPADARYLSNHRYHLMKLRPEEEDLITPQMLQHMSNSGTKDDMRERFKALRDAGYKQITVHARTGHEDVLEDWAEVIDGL